MLETVKFSGKLIQLVHLRRTPESRPYEIARRGPGVRILFYDSQRVLLTREERRETGGLDLRVPGGKVFDGLEPWLKARESAGAVEEAARRAAFEESEQEVGLRPRTLELITKQVCGATMEWDLYCFECTDWTDLGGQSLEPEEAITVQWTPWPEALAAALDGRISEARAAILVVQVGFRLGKLSTR